MSSNLKIDLKSAKSSRCLGQVISISSNIIQAQIPNSAIGDHCKIKLNNGSYLNAEVVAFNQQNILLAPLGSTNNISPGAEVENLQREFSLICSDNLIGKVCNSFGEIISNEDSPKFHGERLSLDRQPPNPLTRKKIEQKLDTGVAAIDSLLTLGYGQRIGLFASAGVGKSTLLGMLVRNAKVDLCVIALVGERGREINEFMEENLGEDGLKKSILVVSTSDEPALCRQMAAYTATSIAEYFRDRGLNVLLVVDSITRTARAIREVGLANGELPVRQGYPASVYAKLSKLLERAGNNQNGSITAIYTVLRNEENDLDPLAEELTSILDGHVFLSKELANSNIRPAIDILNSLSRLQTKLLPEKELLLANKVRKILAKLKSEKDFLRFGGTADTELQEYLDLEVDLLKILYQGQMEYRKSEDVFLAIEGLLGNLAK